MNKTILTGRLTKAPELNEIDSETAVMRFALAVADGKYKGEKQTQFITCVAWNNIADTIATYCQKGDMLSVVGKLQENNYEKDGVKHYQTEVYVTEIELLPQAPREEKEEKEDKPEKKPAKKYSRRG